MKTAPCAISSSLPWLRCTAFGPPVVPEVKTSSARSSGSTGTAGSRAGCVAERVAQGRLGDQHDRRGGAGRGERLGELGREAFLGEHDLAVGVRDVARQRLSAAGRVEAHDHGAAQPGAELARARTRVGSRAAARRERAGRHRAARGTGSRTPTPRAGSPRTSRSHPRSGGTRGTPAPARRRAGAAGRRTTSRLFSTAAVRTATRAA